MIEPPLPPSPPDAPLVTPSCPSDPSVARLFVKVESEEMKIASPPQASDLTSIIEPPSPAVFALPTPVEPAWALLPASLPSKFELAISKVADEYIPSPASTTITEPPDPPAPPRPPRKSGPGPTNPSPPRSALPATFPSKSTELMVTVTSDNLEST